VICSIIGGGLSVKNAQGFLGFKIGVNYTYKYIDVDITYAQDKLDYLKEVPNLHTLQHHNVKNAVKNWSLHGLDFQRDNDHLIMANNSTIGAINVALQLGYKTIYVLGADNKITYPSHFYAHRFPSSRQRDQYEVLFRKVYKRLGQVTLLEDERLIFVESTIDHFENITMDEYNKLLK
jgi:hypothetical protein